MMGFDEMDLFRLVEAAGFEDITVTLELSLSERPMFRGVSWSQLLAMSPNPNAPTYGEAIEGALTLEEATRLETYLRSLMDQGVTGRFRNASAYVVAQRNAA
jgi:hypothetical protein